MNEEEHVPKDARAAVEAWMYEECLHLPSRPSKHYCPDCLLAFAAAQRAEVVVAALEEAIEFVDSHGWWPDAVSRWRAAIRARREGPGGAQ